MSAFRVYDTVQEVVFVFDKDRNLFYGNASASTLLELSAKRLMGGKSMTQFIEFTPDILEEGQTLDMIHESTQYREVQYKTRDGKEGYCQISIQPVPEFFPIDPGQPAQRYLMNIRDVSLEKVLAAKYQAELGQKEVVIGDLKRARAQLEDYSKNLEKMVEQRTAELRESNRLLGTVLDSLGQGILVFDKNGQCLPFFSKVCRDILEIEPTGHAISEVLKISKDERNGFDKWVSALFSEMLSFEDLIPLGPSTYPHSAGKVVALNFNQMRDSANQLVGVVVVATDRTSEVQARQEAENERNYARMVVQIAKHRQQFRAFALEAKSLLRELKIVTGLEGEFAYDEVTRWLHTLKGGAGSFALLDIANHAHLIEQSIIDEKKLQADIGSEFRQKLLTEFSTMEALLLNFLEKNSVLFGGLSESTFRQVEIGIPTLVNWKQACEKISETRGVSEQIFQEYIKEPISGSFLHIDATMQELAQSLGKSVKPLAIIGGDLRIVPELYRELFSSMIHCFRNAIDHGLEVPEIRKLSGKDEAGSVQLRFQKLSKDKQSFFKIEVVDDGKGIDPEKIKAKLVSQGNGGLISGKSDEEIIQFVFANDFSTAERISSVSGRGVGLSAVLEEATRLRGTAYVLSTLGFGSRLVIEVPEREESEESEESSNEFATRSEIKAAC